jgi:type I restriction enzyme, S subunit
MSNVPKLRFSEFSGELEEKRYGDIYSFYSTNSLSRDKLNYENGNVKNIHYGDIHTKFKTMFDIQNENVPFINNDIDLSKIKDESYCLNGDLVIADASEDYNDIGKTMEILNLNNEKVIAGLHTFLARPKKHNMALGFMGYLLQSWKVRKQIMTIAQGTKVLSLSTSRLAEIKLNIPSKKEQEKIASFLSSIDRKIEQLTKKESLLQEYKKGVMQKIFNQEIRFKADDGSEFCDWKEKELSFLYKIKKGSQLNKDTLTEEGNYPAINGGINPSGYTTDWNTQENTITISEGGNSCGYINYITTKFWSGGHNYSLQDLKIQHNNIFIYQYLKHNEKAIMRLRVGSGLPNIQKGDIDAFKIQTPCLEEQTKIANFLSSIDNKIENAKKELEKTKEFKKALLQQMFV